MKLKLPVAPAKKKVWADYIVLATGSRPRYLPELPIDEKIVMTSEGIEAITDFPESMVIVGAGVIGCEYPPLTRYALAG